MIEKIKAPLVAPLLLLFTACSTVTMEPPGGSTAFSGEPTQTETQHFFLWGLAPSSQTVDVAEVCGTASVKKMQTQETFLNGLGGFVTLGIWAPKSVHIWCE